MKPVCELVEKYKDRWLWCALCRCAIVKYTCCGNTTCNAGGCDKCDETYDEIREIERNNMQPSIDQIKGAREAQRESDLDWYMRNKDGILEEPEWWAYIQEQSKYSNTPLMIPTEEEQKAYKPNSSILD